MAVLVFGATFVLFALTTSSVAEDEGATSSVCFREALDPEGLMIGFSCPTALPMIASDVFFPKSSCSSSERLLP